MNRRLPLFLGALALTSTLAGAGVAEAGHAHFHFGGGGGSVRFHGGGGVHWGGGVSVGSSWHFSRPAWRPHTWGVGGSVYVGPRYYYYPRPYYTYYPSYVPSYYTTTSYYPVQPMVAAPGVVAMAPLRPELPKLGIGLFAGGSQVAAQDGGSMHDSDDIGLLGRFRLTPGLLIEGEIGKTSYDEGGVSNVRVDRRLGDSLVYEIGAYNKWAPYVLAGLGVQQAQTEGVYESTQDFAEIGVGLRWAATPRFHITFDLRAGSRSTIADNTASMATPPGTTARTITPPTEASNDNENYTRCRLAAILYF